MHAIKLIMVSVKGGLFVCVNISVYNLITLITEEQQATILNNITHVKYSWHFQLISHVDLFMYLDQSHLSKNLPTAVQDMNIARQKFQIITIRRRPTVSNRFNC